MKRALLAASALAFAHAAGPAAAQDALSAISLRLGGKEVPLSVELRGRLTSLARETLSRCGPNTRDHPYNFGLATYLPARYKETCAKLERNAEGRILMPPPDIAPSCS